MINHKNKCVIWTVYVNITFNMRNASTSEKHFVLKIMRKEEDSILIRSASINMLTKFLQSRITIGMIFKHLGGEEDQSMNGAMVIWRRHRRHISLLLLEQNLSQETTLLGR